jgi:hypothetical protein
MADTGKRYWGVLTPQPAAQLLAYAKQAEASLGFRRALGHPTAGPCLFVRCPRLVRGKPILNFALRSCMLFNIDRCLGGGE